MPNPRYYWAFVDLVAIGRGSRAEATPPDLQEFWDRTLAEARSNSWPTRFERAPSPMALVESYDVTFPGFAGQPIRGWLHLPRDSAGALPCVVQYVGYGGGRGLAHERTYWAAAGDAHFVMDTRGQGSAGSVGGTADPHEGAPEYPGVLTRGIGDPDTYYYRRVHTDAVRAVDAARSHQRVDPARIAVAGASQGGAIARRERRELPQILSNPAN